MSAWLAGPGAAPPNFDVGARCAVWRRSAELHEPWCATDLDERADRASMSGEMRESGAEAPNLTTFATALDERAD